MEVSAVTTRLPFCRRAGRIAMAVVLPVLLSFWIGAEPAFGIDLRDWAQNVRRHRDWTSVEFRNPITGMYIASRAATEDLARQATLTLTASPLEGCRADAVVVIQRGSLNPSDVEELTQVSIDLDDLYFSQLDARIVLPRGDQFAFIEILGPYDTARLAHHRRMTVSLGSLRIARFSLKGFSRAWREVRRICWGFVPR